MSKYVPDYGHIYFQKVEINEKIFIKLIKVTDNFNVLNVGFTTRDPSILRYDLSKRSLQDYKDKSGFWICKICCSTENSFVENKTLFFYVNENGKVYYGIDGEEKGSFDKRIITSGSLWALVDIRSVSNTTQLVDVFKYNLQPLMLHQSRGRNVKLTKNKAYKANENIDISYVFTARPLSLNERVVIKILGMNRKGVLSVGLTSCNPSSLHQIELPYNSESFTSRKEYWLIIKDSSWNLKKDDEVSFSVKDNGELKIMKNSSKLLKVVHVNHRLKLWVLFDFGTLKGIEVESWVQVPFNIINTTDISLPTAPFCESATFDKKITQPHLMEKDHVLAVDKNVTLKSDLPHEKDVNKVEEESECSVCCENSIEVALYPCGHMCMCYECAYKQWQGAARCPFCRGTIIDVLKIYKS